MKLYLEKSEDSFKFRIIKKEIEPSTETKLSNLIDLVEKFKNSFSTRIERKDFEKHEKYLCEMKEKISNVDFNVTVDENFYVKYFQRIERFFQETEDDEIRDFAAEFLSIESDIKNELETLRQDTKIKQKVFKELYDSLEIICNENSVFEKK
ncbi:hypothetical protein EDEG_00802 [Edhazardia aedis USNM 41457]|uniref:Uncharacterized protein n=1 Tax=Edhazardia aedis (strain USNM 41457) TaxID=1003232 RepID=J9DC87_EDHAE|nr:hypothetical protein EDEG_00802 [Edhazardia aedis USNM 41457]|eukprot:EJW05089.1 hypothetical protein EDEG_00802 [Edhazardia aedis USNM 41457]